MGSSRTPPQTPYRHLQNKICAPTTLGGMQPVVCAGTVTMWRDVLQSLFPEFPSELHGVPYLTIKEELVESDLAFSLNKKQLL